MLDETNDKVANHLKARPSARWIQDANSRIGTERLQSYLLSRMNRLASCAMRQYNRSKAHFAALPRRDLLRPVSTISSSSSCFTGSSLTDAAFRTEGSSSSSAEESPEDTSRLTCLADLGVRFCCSAYETTEDTEQGEGS